MPPPVLKLLPPTPHRHDHDALPLESGMEIPHVTSGWLPVRRDGTMAELWKIDEAKEKSGYFRGLPWLAQNGIVRAVFGGGRLPPASGAAVAQW